MKPVVTTRPERFSHWRASYPGDPAKSAVGKTVVRKFIPEFMDDVRQGKDGNDVRRLTNDHE